MPLRFLYFAFGVMAPITIALFVIPVLMMAWVLTALEHAHGKFPPETVFFAIFGATMAVNLAVMLPLGYYLSCTFYGRRMEPALADSQFGRRLFFKVCRQTARVAIIAGIGFFLLSLWPTKPSTSPETKGVGSRPFNFWQRSGLPLVAILIKLGILRYYYRKSGQLENQ